METINSDNLVFYTFTDAVKPISSILKNVLNDIDDTINDEVVK